MILYEKCDQHGWHVGSGPMESVCGVTTDRNKGRGRRWDLENAKAMMGLESLYQSTGLWDRWKLISMCKLVLPVPEIRARPVMHPFSGGFVIVR